jgi:hypothetical protein
MVPRVNPITDIKDRGIILTRKWIREDDVMMHILTRRHGLILTYAHKAAISKRRFRNCCEIFRHIQFFAKRSKSEFCTMEEIITLNYFKPLTHTYQNYQIATQALQLIRTICPPEHPSQRLYILLGGFLQFLTQTSNPHLAWPVFELKVLQAAGIFSMNLILKLAQNKPTLFSSEDLAWYETLLTSQHQQWLFSRSAADNIRLKKLSHLLSQVREDYNLSTSVFS